MLLAGLVVAETGCTKKDQGVAGHTPPARVPDATYTVRGVITALPVAGDARTELRAKHERIPDFKSKDGKIVGMNVMTMDFPPAKGVDLSGMKVGDKVSITFSVWWGNSPGWLATVVKKLPDDTVLDFGNPQG